MMRDPDESPAESFDRYLAEVDRNTPPREPPKRWGRSTIIFGIVEVGIAVAVLVWWLKR